MDRSSSTSADDRLHGPGAAAPAAPRPASTVILVRDGDDGRLQIFMVRRDPRAAFAPDAYVFPGGTLRADDFVAGGAPPVSGLTVAAAQRELAARGGAPPADEADGLAFYVAAIRELYEEAGVLLAHRAELPGAPLDAETCSLLAGLRSEIQAGRSLIQTTLALGLELLPQQLVYFSHWITPEVSPRRYDTRFFLAIDRPEQTPSHCGLETVDGGWFAPADLLTAAQAGQRTLVSVTAEHLRVLAEYRTVADVLAFARTKPVRTVLSRRGPAGWDLGLNGAAW